MSAVSPYRRVRAVSGSGRASRQGCSNHSSLANGRSVKSAASRAASPLAYGGSARARSNLSSSGREVSEDVPRPDLGVCLGVEQLDVRAEHVQGASGPLDEDDRRRAPAERLQAERAGPREQVQDARTHHAGAQGRHPGFSHAVRRGANARHPHRAEAVTLPATRDDPQAAVRGGPEVHEAGLRPRHATPLVPLQPEQHVEEPLAHGLGRVALAQAEPDRLEPSRPALERRLQVTLADQLGAGQLDAAHEEERTGIADAVRSQVREPVGELEVQVPEDDLHVGEERGAQIFGAEAPPRGRVEGFAERRQRVARDVHAGRLPVPAEAPEVGRALRERLVEVQPRDGPRASPALVAVEGDEHDRAMHPLHDPRRHDPDHARVPSFGPEHHAEVGLGIEAFGEQLEGLVQSAAILVAANAVRLLEPARQARGLRRILREEEAKGVGRFADAACGVDARRDDEGEPPGGHVRGRHAGRLQQSREALHATRRHPPQPVGDEHAVLAGERNEVRDRGERHQVQVRREVVARASEQGADQIAQLVRDARSAQPFLRVRTVGPAGVHDRRRIGEGLAPRYGGRSRSRRCRRRVPREPLRGRPSRSRRSRSARPPPHGLQPVPPRRSRSRPAGGAARRERRFRRGSSATA